MQCRFLSALGLSAVGLLAQTYVPPDDFSQQISVDVTTQPATWQYTWYGKPNRYYQVQTSTDLTVWTALPGFTPRGTGATLGVNFVLTDSPTFFVRATELYPDGSAGTLSARDDTNSNGLSDIWEQYYFGYLGVNPAADPDGDGRTNLQEYQAGTNPLDIYKGRAFVISSASGSSLVYTYDNSGRITGATYPNSIAAIFAQDAASNLSSATLASTAPIAAWRTAHSLPADGSGNGDDTTILAGDALPNLAKYAFGLDPNVTGVGEFPSINLLSLSGGYYLTLAYPRPEPTPADLTYSVEVSNDNGATWTSGTGVTVPVSTSIYSGTAMVVVRDATAVNSLTSLGRRIRLNILRRSL